MAEKSKTHAAFFLSLIQKKYEQERNWGKRDRRQEKESMCTREIEGRKEEKGRRENKQK
jgi:hypothetical protein